ncbi:GDSL esterase/lipase EXL3-like [Rutidosis leptorrhynchoides]|uniref:GDSL esterase/lipase EXL3-like n=1 Tax=Rutidosis leptorrhynchoides TaxID=125765 RepID=UPI003A99AA53
MILSVVKVVVFSVYAFLGLQSNEAKIVYTKGVVAPAVLLFGDSFVDQGNNNYVTNAGKANYPPYGKDFPGEISTGRWSNGKSLADGFANALGVKEYVPAYLDPSIQVKDLVTGVSFASGSTGYDPDTAKENKALSLETQLDMFKQYIKKLKMNIGEVVTNNVITNSVCLLLGGSNDIQIKFFGIPYKRRQNDVRVYAKTLVTFALSYVQELHKLGARRIAVFGAPPLGCFPEQRTVGGGPLRKCVDNLNAAFQWYNDILKRELQNLSSVFPESKFAYVDFYNPVLSVMENHRNYGFEVIDKGCCGTGLMEVSTLCNKLTPICDNRTKFFFWDGYHFTEKGCNIIVNHTIADLINGLF